MRERTFQSREIIWSTFESLARELDAPIDDLVNEAMAAYAKVRGYPKADQPPPMHPSYQQQQQQRQPAHYDPHDEDPLEATHDAPAISALDRSYSPPSLPRPAPPPAAGRGFDDDDDDLAKTAARGNFTRPAQGRDLREPGEESRTTPRYAAAFSRPIGAAASAPPPMAMPPPARAMGRAMSAPPSMSGPPPLPPRLMPPTTMPMPGAPPRENTGLKRLVLLYQGRTYNVEKERYLLGRSKTQADLRLDDPNVSRQHAVIERVGSAWYIVDLGSTNGVHVAGDRVARRALQDGDVIVITSHEIRCTLR